MADSNPGGPGGKQRRIQANKPMGKTSHRKAGGSGVAAWVKVAFVVVIVVTAWVVFF